ncbi:MAG: zf-HC2 domain-containing protein [Alphaproteobacteria bacterium]|nr:zf-HC2 domain-containing protein [Alphaproteobacteria bacterium]
MSPAPRLVAGLWCHEVLDALPDYLSGELPADTRALAEAHLRGCEWCTAFGGSYAGLVRQLRDGLGPAEDVPDAVGARLDALLDSD